MGITLPQEPYLQDMTGTINFKGNVVRVPGITFSSFDGTGVAGVTYTFDTQAYAYGINLKNVNAQKAIDSSIDAYVTTKDYSSYKDKLYGNLNLVYAGAGRGISGDTMIATAVGKGNYALDDTNVKNLPFLSPFMAFFKDPSNEIEFDRVAGDLAMKNKVFSYTAGCEGKVGHIRETGGIDCSTLAYSPDMKIQCDIKKQFINSDAVMSSLPDSIRGSMNNLDWLADSQGNIPLDFRFTGVAAENHYNWDSSRLIKNVTGHLGQQLQNSAQPIIQNLGSQLKKLF